MVFEGLSEYSAKLVAGLVVLFVIGLLFLIEMARHLITLRRLRQASFIVTGKDANNLHKEAWRNSN